MSEAPEDRHRREQGTEAPAADAGAGPPEQTGEGRDQRPAPGARSGAPLEISGDEQGPEAGGDTAPQDLVAAAVAQRDEYLDTLRRLQADFENYRKRVAKQQADQAARAAEDLVGKLLPVLDTVDLALAHAVADPGAGASAPVPPPAADASRTGEAGEQPAGDTAAGPAEIGALVQVSGALRDILSKEGLERIDPQGQPFDPTEHDAVLHEPGGGGSAPEVTEVMRAGYRWRGRVLRPAMVKVKG